MTLACYTVCEPAISKQIALLTCIVFALNIWKVSDKHPVSVFVRK